MHFHFCNIHILSSNGVFDRISETKTILPPHEFSRGSAFKEDDGTWKGNEDGKVINNQPTRVLDDRNGGVHHAGYISR